MVDDITIILNSSRLETQYKIAAGGTPKGVGLLDWTFLNPVGLTWAPSNQTIYYGRNTAVSDRIDLACADWHTEEERDLPERWQYSQSATGNNPPCKLESESPAAVFREKSD